MDTILHAYDKLTYKQFEVGKVQTDFNMSRVIDGTKDSVKLEVVGYEDYALEPNTICQLEPTRTWWIVKNDKTKRYKNEGGYFYIHSIELLGAIDLLNSRDLVDSGFNQNRYTIETFIKRIIAHSTFEYDYSIDYCDSIDKDKAVNYVKTYENYTPLSALRDFLSGYNCDVKLTFVKNLTTNYLVSAVFTIIPKTGRLDLPILTEDEFDDTDIRKIKTYNKESYGTTVISNAQNVISTQAKTFPQFGGVRLTGETWDTDSSSAYIDLPSPAYKVNWVRAIMPQSFAIIRNGNVILMSSKIFFPQSDNIFDNMIQEIIDKINDDFDHFTQEQKTQYIAFINDNIEKIREYAIACSRLTFYNVPKYNVDAGEFGKPIVDNNYPYGFKDNGEPVLPALDNDLLGSSHLGHWVILTDNESRNLFKKSKLWGLYWERGSNKIKGFDAFAQVGTTPSGVFRNIHRDICDLRLSNLPTAFELDITTTFMCVYANYGSYREYQHIKKGETLWQVNYIPLSDIKVKVDNDNDTNDTKLYNQNGKLTDSNGLAKLTESYSKEIESPTITKYGHYYSFNDIPQIGQRVKIYTSDYEDEENDIYVITNISYDFSPNEETTGYGYYIECEFTLSKYVATKSIMTNPNTNIRDYGIPQNYNVKRRQVYRDYYTFDFKEDINADQNSFVDISYYISDTYQDISLRTFDHTAIIKMTYEEETDGHLNWYYQLNSTVFTLHNCLYEIFDFKDNNIIGYDLFNSTTGFKMNDIWATDTTTNITTPVSYVDDNGEAKGIELACLNKDELSSLYDDICSSYPKYRGLVNQHVFVGEEFYEGSGTTQNDQVGVSLDTTCTATAPYNESITVTMSLTDLYDLIGLDPDIDIDFSHSDTQNVNVSFEYNGTLLTPRVIISSVLVDTDNDLVAITALCSFMGGSGLEIGTTYDVNLSCNITYQYETFAYYGAKDRTNFKILETSYYKDATEVPVFEYSLQLGGNPNVELGENLFNTDGAMFITYSFKAQDPYSQTPLMYEKPQELNIEFVDDSDDPNYKTYSNLHQFNAVILEFNNDKTELKLKFYTRSDMSDVYSNDKKAYKFTQNRTTSIQIGASSLIGKDIVIGRNIIQEINATYDGAIIDDVELVQDNDLFMIIHSPTEDDFDENNALVLKVNHYKLK